MSPRLVRAAFTVCVVLGAMRAQARTELDYATLMAGSFPHTVDFSAYAPDADASAPLNVFSGVLALRFGGTLPHRTLRVDPAYVDPAGLAQALTWPEDFAYAFVQQGEALVPARRGAIPGRHSWWEVILEPGRVWNEPGDRGYSRAAIPFSLMEKNANCTHHGVLMFLFRSDGAVSRTAMQIASETCPYLHLDLWGLLASEYRPGAVPGGDAALAQYRTEVAARLPRASLAQLHTRYPALDVAALAIGAPEGRTLFGLVVDGVNYLSGCATRSGEYPYCDELDLPSYSLAKSLFAAAALMRLQAGYPQTQSQRIAAHVPQCRLGAWERITFVQALDMSTGSYDSPIFPDDENAAKTHGLFLALDHGHKIRYSCSAYPRRAPPGSRWDYHTSDTYVLGTALAHYLRSLPGHGHDDLFDDLVYAQVYAPLRLSATSSVTRRTYDAIAQPFTGWGLVFQPGDIARLGRFLAVDHGTIEGRAVLDPLLLRQALQRDAGARGLRAAQNSNLRYQHGFWGRNLSRELGCTQDTWVPYMSGFGGISVVLFPNGVVYYNFADDNLPASYDWAKAAAEARKLGEYCK